jgi:hypothetical protein
MEYSQNFPFFFAKSKIFEAMNSKDIALAAKYALEFLKRRSPERNDKKDNNSIICLFIKLQFHLRIIKFKI